MKSRGQPQQGRAYLLQRAVDERRAAARATCDEARLAHRQFARCYAAEARVGAAGARHPDPDPSAPARSRLSDLGKLNGADFDRAYLAGQVDAHEEALSLMRDYAKHGDVAPLKAAAGEIVPVVEKHLDRVRLLKG